jgi:hypothetical protein
MDVPFGALQRAMVEPNTLLCNRQRIEASLGGIV